MRIGTFRTSARRGALALAVLVLILWAFAPSHGHSGTVSPDRCAACTLSRHCPTILAEAVEAEGPSLVVTPVSGQAPSLDLPLRVSERVSRAPPA